MQLSALKLFCSLTDDGRKMVRSKGMLMQLALRCCRKEFANWEEWTIVEPEDCDEEIRWIERQKVQGVLCRWFAATDRRRRLDYSRQHDYELTK